MFNLGGFPNQLKSLGRLGLLFFDRNERHLGTPKGGRPRLLSRNQLEVLVFETLPNLVKRFLMHHNYDRV